MFNNFIISIFLMGSMLLSSSFASTASGVSLCEEIVQPSRVLLIKKAGDEKFLAKFPTDPVVSGPNNRMEFKAHDGRDVFKLEVIPFSDEAKDSLLRSFLGFRRVDAAGKEAMEIIALERKSFLPTFVTVMISGNNIYCLSTSATKDVAIKHTLFVDSFCLVQKD